jgi:hypothetical protein
MEPVARLREKIGRYGVEKRVHLKRHLQCTAWA